MHLNMPHTGRWFYPQGFGDKPRTIAFALCVLVMCVKVSECQNRGSGEDYLQVTENRQAHGSWFTGSCEYSSIRKVHFMKLFSNVD